MGAGAVSTTDRHVSSSDTSPITGWTWSASVTGATSTATTSYPPATSRRTVAAPIPAAAPVTTAHRLFNSSLRKLRSQNRLVYRVVRAAHGDPRRPVGALGGADRAVEAVAG